MLEGLVLVVCHEALHYHLIGLDVHIGPSVGQGGCTALNRYARPFAIVDGQFALVVWQGLAICQHFQEGRLSGGYHTIGEELCGKVEVVRSRLVYGTMQGQVAVLVVLLYLRTEVFQWVARIDTYATAVLLCHRGHGARKNKGGQYQSLFHKIPEL